MKDRLNQTLEVNDLVLFYQTNSGLLRGVVTKVNPKTVTVNPLRGNESDVEFGQRLHANNDYDTVTGRKIWWISKTYNKTSQDVVKIGYIDKDENPIVFIGDPTIWNKMMNEQI